MLEEGDFCFIYSLFNDATLTVGSQQDVIILPAQHLMQITQLKKNFAAVDGQYIIIVYLTSRK